MSQIQSEQRRRLSRLEWISLALVAALGISCLPLPFTGDQALFAVAGKSIAHGAVYYRDFWDVKQPGIYWFYAVGGRLFGFSEVGIHLFELICWLGFAGFLMVTLRGRYEHAWVTAVVPLFTVGAYYVTARAVSMTQVEALVGMPLYLSWWFCQNGDPRTTAGKARLVMSGAFGAVVVLFKHLYVLIALAFWVLSAIRGRRSITPHRSASAALMWIGVGILVPLVGVAAYFAAYGQLGRMAWTVLVAGPEVAKRASRDPSQLIRAAGAWGAAWLPVVLLGGWAIARRLFRDSDPLLLDMCLWLAIGSLAILVQNWWSYTPSLFIVPVGLLGAAGLDQLVTDLRERSQAVHAAAVALLVVSCAYGAGLATQRGLRLVQHDAALTAEGRRGFRGAYVKDYDLADASVAFLRADGPSDGIYVLGNPIYLLRSGRRQAIAVNGWSPEFYTAQTWRDIQDELSLARPRFILVGDSEFATAKRFAPDWVAFLDARYELERKDPGNVTWYRLRARG